MVLAIALGISSLLLFIHTNSNHTFAAHRHGLNIYLPNHEHTLFIELQLGAYIAFLVGFLLNSRWRVFTDPLDRLAGKQRGEVLEDRQRTIRPASYNQSLC